MPATLMLDRKIEDTLFDNGVDFKRYVRNAVVSNIDVPATGYDANVLIKSLAVSGLPQLGDLHPSIADCRVQRHLVRGLASNQVTIAIYYETGQTGSAISPVGTYVLRDSSALTTEETQVTYDGGHPIKISYRPTGITNPPIDTWVANVNHLVPLRVLSASAVVNGKPSDAMLSAIGRVNASPWQGLPTGYWLCAGVNSQIQQQNGSLAVYTVDVSFMTKNSRDWSTYVTFKDDRGHVPADIDANDVRNFQTFSYASVLQSGGVYANGITKVALYGLSDFSSLFPF